MVMEKKNFPTTNINEEYFVSFCKAIKLDRRDKSTRTNRVKDEMQNFFSKFKRNVSLRDYSCLGNTLEFYDDSAYN